MFTFKVKPDKETGVEPYEVTATSRDITKWETDFKSSLRILHENLSMVRMVQVAWVASVRQGKWQDTMGEFRDRCDVELVKGADSDEDENGDVNGAGDPTLWGPSTEP
jgi:hypothetical protein